MRLLLTAAFVASVTAQTAGTLAFTGSLTDTGCYDMVADGGWVRQKQSSQVPPFSLHPTPSHFSSLAIHLPGAPCTPCLRAGLLWSPILQGHIHHLPRTSHSQWPHGNVRDARRHPIFGLKLPVVSCLVRHTKVKLGAIRKLRQHLHAADYRRVFGRLPCQSNCGVRSQVRVLQRQMAGHRLLWRALRFHPESE